jgi:ribosomal protein S18/ribosomal protein S6
MIYETAVVLRTDATDEAVKKFKDTILETFKEFSAELLIEDAWGVKQFAQPTADGVTKGNYFYYMYKAGTNLNAELERKFKISEDIMKFIIVKLGEDKDQAAIMKAYKNPSYDNSEAARESDKDKKMFSKRKSCWFSAKKTEPDWKDPSTYSWLVNEFGKISPQRITGLRPRYQRMATTAIKRGRCMGLISYLSNYTAR